MSTQGRGLPWSRGRGFRPKGPFQPARRPGEPAGTGGGDNTPAQNNSNSVSSNQGYSSNQGDSRNQGYSSNQGYSNNQGYKNKPIPSNQQVNNGYMGNKETRFATNQGRNNASSGSQSRPIQNGYQGNNSQFGNQGNSTSKDVRVAASQQQQNHGNSDGAKQMQSSQNGTGEPSGDREVCRVLAKYSYKANPSSPLGERELSLTQGQKLTLTAKHPDNEQWWKVKSDEGGEGYVPASYVMVLEEKVTSLPWLANNKAQEEPLPECKPVFKPYKSAYDQDGQVNKKPEPEEKKPNVAWYCAVCEKQLNGPKPYGAHMASKWHKEEVEIAKENGTYVDPYLP